MRKLAHLSGLVLCATLVAGALTGAAGGQGPTGVGNAAQRLERELGPGVEVAVHRETGAVRFLGTAPGRPVARRPGIGPDATPPAAARAFLDDYGDVFGLDRTSASLRVAGTVRAPRGGAAVRLRQEIGGVPVLAGELAVSVDARGNVLSALGELEPDPVDTSAEIGAADARAIALTALAKGRPEGGAGLRTTTPSLAIYDSRLLGGPGLGVPALVWAMEVSSPSDPTLRQLVLIDADLGVVAEAIDLIETAKDRRVCDAGNKDSDYPCVAPYDREEGEAATGSEDIDAAYDFAGDAYDFFFDRFGRDSLDAEGLPLTSTVRYCPEGEPCPYENAFWDGEQMVYGEGFAAADDVVGHELSHGFTQFTSNLFYWYQSGAINESMSDVFGEYMDLTNGVGNDSASVRWLLGEDIPGVGAIRDMKNPPAFGDPDRMTSSKYVADVNQVDNGGVHSNSGVNNKAAYLIADGDTFNGTEVTGIGIDKAARVYYEAEAGLLTSGSDYADLFEALQQACVNSIGGGEGITVSDCNEVGDAVAATEMNQQPLVAPAPEAPVCGSGEEPVDLFFDNLENPASGNWAHSALSGGDGWYYPQNPNLFSWLDATYATSGKTNFWGYDLPTTSDYAIAQTLDIAVPAGKVYLRFDHSYAFEDSSTPVRHYDGGRLEYSVNGGSTWQDAGPLFTHNGYNGTIEKKYGNPLAGQSAFTAESYGYISSRADLSSLSGEEVRFRFRIGTDEIVDDYGWFVDDVRIYGCEEAEPPPDETPPETTIETGPEGLTNDSTPTFAFSADEEPVSFECSLDEAAFAPCASPHTTATLPDGPHGFEVRATDAAENTDPTPAKRTFTVDATAPAAPSLLGTDPPSPANDNEPLVTGEAEPSSTVYLYSAPTTSECKAPNLLATGTAASFESPGLQVTVPGDATTTFRARAEDAAGNVSGCSSALAYAEDSQAPDTTIDVGPEGTTDDPTPTFEFSSSEEPATFQCRLDEEGFGPCTSPLTAEALKDGPHTFQVRATDLAGNTDASSAEREFIVDTAPPPGPEPEPEPELEPESEPDPGPAPEPEATPPLPQPPVILPDIVPPSSILSGRRRQMAGHPVVVRARCGEPCTVIAGGRIVVWRGDARGSARRAARVRMRLGLKRVARGLATGQSATLRLRPHNRRAQRRLRRLVRRGSRAKAVVWVRYIDLAGNATTERMRVGLRARRR